MVGSFSLKRFIFPIFKGSITKFIFSFYSSNKWCLEGHFLWPMFIRRMGSTLEKKYNFKKKIKLAKTNYLYILRCDGTAEEMRWNDNVFNKDLLLQLRISLRQLCKWWFFYFILKLILLDIVHFSVW